MKFIDSKAIAIRKFIEGDTFEVKPESVDLVTVTSPYPISLPASAVHYFNQALSKVRSVEGFAQLLPITVVLSVGDQVSEYKIRSRSLSLLLKEGETLESLGLREVKRRLLKSASKNNYNRIIKVVPGNFIRVELSKKDLLTQAVEHLKAAYLSDLTHFKIGLSLDGKVITTSEDDLLIEFYNSNEAWIGDAVDLDPKLQTTWRGQSYRDIKVIFQGSVEALMKYDSIQLTR